MVVVAVAVGCIGVSVGVGEVDSVDIGSWYYCCCCSDEVPIMWVCTVEGFWRGGGAGGDTASGNARRGRGIILGQDEGALTIGAILVCQGYVLFLRLILVMPRS